MGAFFLFIWSVKEGAGCSRRPVSVNFELTYINDSMFVIILLNYMKLRFMDNMVCLSSSTVNATDIFMAHLSSISFFAAMAFVTGNASSLLTDLFH